MDLNIRSCASYRNTYSPWSSFSLSLASAISTYVSLKFFRPHFHVPRTRWQRAKVRSWKAVKNAVYTWVTRLHVLNVVCEAFIIDWVQMYKVLWRLAVLYRSCLFCNNQSGIFSAKQELPFRKEKRKKKPPISSRSEFLSHDASYKTVVG